MNYAFSEMISKKFKSNDFNYLEKYHQKKIVIIISSLNT